MMQDPKTFSADPSPLYGRQFNKGLRDAIFKKAQELFGYPDDARADYVGTEYYVLRTVEMIGELLIANGHKAAAGGAGYYVAYGPWLDFSEMVARESFSQRPFVPKTTAKPGTKPIEAVKPGTKLGDTVDPATMAELQAAVGNGGGIEPAPAPDFKPEPNKKKGKGKKPAEPATPATAPATAPATEASPDATESVDEPAPALQAAVG